MATEVAAMASIQDRVRDRIKEAFVDLIPAEMWEQMVKAEIEAFTKKELPELVRHEAREAIKSMLAEEFKKPGWQARWDDGQRPSEFVTKILADTAPNFVAAVFGELAQRLISDIRNGNLLQRY